MRKWNCVLASALAAMLLTAQPVWADTEAHVVEVNTEVVQEASASSVIVVGYSRQQETEAVGPGVALQQEKLETALPQEGEAQTETDAQTPAETAAVEQNLPESAAAQSEAVQTEEVQSGERVVDPSRPMIALTYDDGPQPSVGNRIMDCLAQYGGKATFFMVGERVPRFASEVQRMVAEGHEVANHTQNHYYLQKKDAATIQAQVAQCNAAIQAACGVTPTLMRLPGGNHNATVRANVNMPMIQWNIDTKDWKTRNADATVSAVLNHVKDGDIVLMHELYSQTADATERMVPELVNRGFQLVTVSELAAAKGHTVQAGQLYSAFR